MIQLSKNQLCMWCGGCVPADTCSTAVPTLASDGTELHSVQYESKAVRKRQQAAQLTAERRSKEAELAEVNAQAQAASNEAARKEAQLDAHHGTPPHY